MYRKQDGHRHSGPLQHSASEAVVQRRQHGTRRSELMIVLIPHVIRRPEITPENLRAIAVGNFATVKVNYARRSRLSPRPPHR
jgi:hypothetical protein